VHLVDLYTQLCISLVIRTLQYDARYIQLQTNNLILFRALERDQKSLLFVLYVCQNQQRFFSQSAFTDFVLLVETNCVLCEVRTVFWHIMHVRFFSLSVSLFACRMINRVWSECLVIFVSVVCLLFAIPFHFRSILSHAREFSSRKSLSWFFFWCE